MIVDGFEQKYGAVAIKLKYEYKADKLRNAIKCIIKSRSIEEDTKFDTIRMLFKEYENCMIMSDNV